jgi:hypothetical protein
VTVSPSCAPPEGPQNGWEDPGGTRTERGQAPRRPGLPMTRLGLLARAGGYPSWRGRLRVIQHACKVDAEQSGPSWPARRLYQGASSIS